MCAVHNSLKLIQKFANFSARRGGKKESMGEQVIGESEGKSEAMKSIS